MTPPRQPPSERLTEQDVLAHLRRHPQTLRQIAEALDLSHAGRRDLKKIVEHLAHTGAVEKSSGDQYRLPRDEMAAPGAPRAAAAGGRADGATRTGQQGFAATRSLDRPAPRPPEKFDPNRVTGRMVMHRDGYGFLVPDKPVPGIDGDLYIGRENTGDAMHGDRVVARIEKRKFGGRASGAVVRIEARAHPTVVGIFQYGATGNTVRPFDDRLQQDIVIPPGEELLPELRARVQPEELASATSRRRLRFKELSGAVVNVALTRFPRGGVQAAGRVVELLGRTGEMGVDVEIVIRKHHLPNRFPADVLEQAASVQQTVAREEREGRGDFRELPIVTIDGETAKDFDDAVYVDRLPGGRWQLQVHIADVAHYVRPGSAIDHEARLRGTSVYFPDRAVPMLPVELSNQICSLNPQVERLVMSALLEIDANGATVNAEFLPGVIRSAERMTYTNVFRVLEGEAEARERYAAFVPHFQNMKELAQLLNTRRTRRGAIDFDLPEPVLEFDAMGRMTGILRSERNFAHRLIEEFMLAANEAVAQYLEGRGLGLLFRVHEKPDPKKVLEFEELAQAFGHTLGVEDLSVRRLPVRHGSVRQGRGQQAGREGRRGGGGGRERPMTVTLPGSAEFSIRPQHYQNLTRKIAGLPEERILSYLMLRSLKQARYGADPATAGHFALATRDYTHFTSPIRRYPDLIVHRVLKWALENPEARPGAQASRPGPYSPTELAEIALETSESERRADAAERELTEWKTAQYMEQHLGEEYGALVIGAQKWGVYVELVDVFVEGLIPIGAIEEFAGERCFFRERDRTIVTQGGSAVCRLGDRVHVRADRIDPFLHRVEFALVGGAGG